MVELLKNVLSGNNQFAAGGLLLMIVGGLSVYLRAVPQKAWEWLVGQITLSLTVKDEDTAFVWVKEWFLEQGFLRRVRRVDLDTTVRSDRLALIPAPGRHWFWNAGRPFTVEFHRSEETRGWLPRRSESFSFQTIGRRQSFLKQFVSEIVECHRRNCVSSLFVHDDGWNRVSGYTPRQADSIVLPAGEMERLMQDVARFKASKNRYRQLGVPYHRGYLLHGPPGTGKSSLTSAIAASFAMSIYAINLGDFNDRTLINAVHEVPLNSVILFEDIDCMSTGRAGERRDIRSNRLPIQDDERKGGVDKFGVTLSGLLNVLDGFNTPEDVLFVMTSNCIESIDQALLRPGRIDYRLYLGKATREQKTELYRRFFRQASAFEAQAFVEAHPWADTMAEFQGLLLSLEENEDCPEAAIVLR